MGRKFKFAGNKDFGAFSFQGDVIYDVDQLGDVADDFVDQCVAAGAAEVTTPKAEAPSQPAQPKAKTKESK